MLTQLLGLSLSLTPPTLSLSLSGIHFKLRGLASVHQMELGRWRVDVQQINIRPVMATSPESCSRELSVINDPVTSYDCPNCFPYQTAIDVCDAGPQWKWVHVCMRWIKGCTKITTLKWFSAVVKMFSVLGAQKGSPFPPVEWSYG